MKIGNLRLHKQANDGVLQSPDQLSPIFFEIYPKRRGKYPIVVLLVAMVEFDGRR
jgi:hypothetical protein